MPNTVTEKKDHYIMIKGSVQQKDITFVNMYVSNIHILGAPSIKPNINRCVVRNTWQYNNSKGIYHITFYNK